MSAKQKSDYRVYRYLTTTLRPSDDRLRQLLESGAAPNGRPVDRESPLELAIREEMGQATCPLVDVLLSHGADVEGGVRPGERTPLLKTLDRGDWVIAESLLAHGADIHRAAGAAPMEVANAIGQMVRHVEYAPPEPTWEWMERLVALGVDINYRNPGGRTALHLACLAHWHSIDAQTFDVMKPETMVRRSPGDPEVTALYVRNVEKLLELGADPTIRDVNRCTPFMICWMRRTDEAADNELTLAPPAEAMAERLREAAPPTDLDLEVATVFNLLARDRHGEAFEVWQRGAQDVEHPHFTGGSLLTWVVGAAPWNGGTKLGDAFLQAVLDRETELDRRGMEGDAPAWTALTVAVKVGDVPLVEELLKRGADPNIPQDGWTLLEWVEQENPRSPLLEVLKRHGATETLYVDLRGLGTWQDDVNLVVLVEGEAPEVARVLASQLADAEVLEKAQRKKPVAREASFLVVGLVGHTWCQVHPIWFDGSGAELARRLAKAGQWRTIFCEQSDFRECYGYELYDPEGRPIEGYYWGSEEDFFLLRDLSTIEDVEGEGDEWRTIRYSELGRQWRDDQGEEITTTLDHALKELDAWVPHWTDKQLMTKPGKKTKSLLSSEKKRHFRHVIYVAGDDLASPEE